MKRVFLTFNGHKNDLILAELKQLKQKKIQHVDVTSDFEDHKSGVSCIFFKHKDIGIKIYEDIDEAKGAIKLQAKAAAEGLAPRVLSRLITFGYYDYGDGKIVTGYGFFTQVAKGCGKARAYSKYARVIDGLGKIGIIMSDDHAGNFGVLDNKVVCIDFCMVSVYNEGFHQRYFLKHVEDEWCI